MRGGNWNSDYFTIIDRTIEECIHYNFIVETIQTNFSYLSKQRNRGGGDRGGEDYFDIFIDSTQKPVTNLTFLSARFL